MVALIATPDRAKPGGAGRNSAGENEWCATG